MKESKVEAYILKHLAKKGWRVTTLRKMPGEHGVDIKAWHPQKCRNVLIEVKGGSGKHKFQERHSSFYNVLGQLLARMDIEGNRPNRGRIYGIGLPNSWAETYKRKVKKMEFGWKLLRPKLFLVKWNGIVIEKSYRFFLKK